MHVFKCIEDLTDVRCVCNLKNKTYWKTVLFWDKKVEEVWPPPPYTHNHEKGISTDTRQS